MAKTTAAAPPPRRAGQRLGRFCLLGELGRGAQATVWRAHDERLDREVALKLLTGLDSAQPLDQWLHEARAVSRLAHPHIVPVFDADCFDGQPGLVFELVPGGTLAQLLRQRGALPARDAVELMLGVVDALRAAHAQYYFPDEAEAIRALLRQPHLAGPAADRRVHADVLADRAASSVLGLGFEALGVGVARHWGLPESLQRCMRRPDGAPPHQRLPCGPDRQRWLAVAANELANDLWQHAEAALPARLDLVAQRHGPGLGFTLPDLLRATGQARQVLSQMALAMAWRCRPNPRAGTSASPASPARRLDARRRCAPTHRRGATPRQQCGGLPYVPPLCGAVVACAAPKQAPTKPLHGRYQPPDHHPPPA